MNKVRPGEPVRGRLEARTHNTLLDVAEDYRRNRGKFFDPKAIGGDGVLPALTVSAYRDTGDGDLGEQCPCVLRFTDGADPGLQDPTQNVLGYMRRPTVYALSPTTGDEAEAIGITARAIPEGQFGPVYVQGVVLCTVNVSNTGHEYATLTNNATYLASATSGPAKILWKETASTGSQTCLVMLNGGLTAADTIITVDNVHVTADLATSPATYTVKAVHRNGSGVLVEDSPTVSYTAYEAQNRAPVVDPTSTPTHEIPLYIDSNSKYYFQIDQYADGTASPVLAGHVSTADQTFEGPKHFNDEVEVNAQNNDGTGFTDDAVFLVNDSSAGDYLLRGWATGGPNGLLPKIVIGDNASSGSGVSLSVAGDVAYGTQLVGTDGTHTWIAEVGAPAAGDSIGFYSNTSASPAGFYAIATDTKGVADSLILFLNGGADYDTAFTIAGSNGSGTGQTGTYTFGGGATGDVASMTFVGGILTAVTLVP